MNKQTIGKAQLFLGGIIGRIDENADFFEGIDVTFTAGTKKFFLKAMLCGERCGGEKRTLEFIFCGEKYVKSLGEFGCFIGEKMQDYDSMVLTYAERGRSIVLEASGKDVRTRTEARASAERSEEDYKKHVGTSVMSRREYYIKAGDAENLLKVIGIMGKNGKIRNDMIRKYNQIDHFVELIHPLLESLCSELGGKNAVRIIDCACGKSYLSFVLNYYIKEVMGRKCYFTGLDYNPVVIADSEKMASELRYNNMEFIETNIMYYEPKQEYDLLLTLHACDTATDMALNFAMKNNVKHIVCVPCCHREMNETYSLGGFEDILKYGILKARIADALTDGMRAKYLEAYGYDVSVVEYISPLDTPKNLMIRAEKRRGIDYDKIREFYDLCEKLGTSLTIGDF